MSEPFLFFSNRTEILYEKLKSQLFSAVSHPFAKRLVIIQGSAMQNWIMTRLANDLGIATGIEYVFINQAFSYLSELTLNQHSYCPSILDLTFAIELELRSFVQYFPHFNTHEKKEWGPLASYLIDQPSDRIVHLSHQLGKDFFEYGKTNVSPPNENWQGKLWHSIFSKNLGWSWPALQYLQQTQKPIHLSIYFFALTDINRIECDYLLRLSQLCPVHYYFLSPCMMYWSDTRSDRERASLLNYWEERNIPGEQLLLLDRLLEDRNPLLANWGKRGRQWISYWEDKLAQSDSCYHLTSNAPQKDEILALDNIILEGGSHRLTLLEAIQSDLLTLRNPEISSVINLTSNDDSLQLHVAPNKRREVEALYHSLLDILHRNSEITPSDILVISPQLNEYRAFIQSCFLKQDSLLELYFCDDSSIQLQMITQVVFDLIDLADNRWEVPQILQVMANPFFQCRHQLTETDFRQISVWVKEAKITWGYDDAHRECLFLDGHAESISEKNAYGTWMAGIERLKQITARSNIEEETLFSRFQHILETLYSDINNFKNNQNTLEGWVRLFHQFIKTHLSPQEDRSESTEAFDYLLDQISKLGESHRHFKQSLFSYASITHHLRQFLNQKKQNYHEKSANSIAFGSFVDLHAIPKKVIVLLGMDECTFPQLGNTLSHFSADNHTFFSQSDKDRYHFLETLLSTRMKLLIFYSKHNGKKSEEQLPSPVILELLSYCDRFYSYDGMLPSIHCTRNHPFYAFSVKYFDETSHCRSYSINDYKNALKSIQNKQPRPTLLKQFGTPSNIRLPLQEANLSLHELRQAAKNPIKLFLNKTMGIYLENSEKQKFQKEDALRLTSLDKFNIREKMLYRPLEQVLKGSEFQMTSGLFREVAQQQSIDEAFWLHGKLANSGIQSKELFHIEFLPECVSPMQVSAHAWHFPAPTFTRPNHEKIVVKGKLSNVSSQGLLLQEKNSVSTRWKHWPSLLMLAYAYQMKPDIMQNQVVYTQSAKTSLVNVEDPLMLFSHWCSYYHQCLEQFSPLLPDWVPFILEKDSEGLKKEQEKMYSDFSSSYAHQELRWVIDPANIPNPETIVKEWSDLAQMLFERPSSSH